MRFPSAICCLLIIATCCVPSARAQDQASLQARIAARYDLDLAKNDLRNYWQIEYPRRQRELNAAIELTELELRNNQSLLHEFHPFTQFSLGEPFPVTVRDLQFCIKECELRLKNLRAERNALIRFHGDQFRMLEMRVLEARLRVAELEANDVATSEPATK
jgi:hypothetical protein